MLNTNAKPFNGVNGVNDITEKDRARQRYYELYSQQSWWNLQRQVNYNKKQQDAEALRYVVRVLTIIALIALIVFIAAPHK